jgi:hypothetical protein
VLYTLHPLLPAATVFCECSVKPFVNAADLKQRVLDSLADVLGIGVTLAHKHVTGLVEMLHVARDPKVRITISEGEQVGKIDRNNEGTRQLGADEPGKVDILTWSGLYAMYAWKTIKRDQAPHGADSSAARGAPEAHREFGCPNGTRRSFDHRTYGTINFVCGERR